MHHNINFNVEHLVLLQTFKQRAYLKVHVTTFHGQEKRFKCNECPLVNIQLRSTIIISNVLKQKFYLVAA